MKATTGTGVDAALLLGRVLVVVGLIPNGLRKLSEFSAFAAGMGGDPQLIGGVPFPDPEPLFYFPFPALFLAASIALDIGGAMLVMLGIRTKLLGFVLAVYCLAAMIIFHPMLGSMEELQPILRNAPLIGGLLLIAGAGAGRWSLEGRVAK